MEVNTTKQHRQTHTKNSATMITNNCYTQQDEPEQNDDTKKQHENDEEDEEDREGDTHKK